MKYLKWLWFQLLSLFLVLCAATLNGQGIGDNIAFQGLTNQNAMTGVKARAMGNAFTAEGGDVNTIFYNPAGLADINSLQMSVSFRNNNIKTFERQQYLPVASSYGIMELIWSGIYTPQLADDGIRSDKILYSHDDFNAADSAVEYFDEKFADWIKEKKSSGINNITAAYPFRAFDRNIVASGSYTSSSVFDFDRNDHVMGTDYGPGRAITDSNWYMYTRQRIGDMNNFIGALAANIDEKLNVGMSFEYMWGESEDILSNEIFAHMQITQEQNPNRLLPNNTYYFWHDSTTYGISGKSDFSYLKIGLGAIYKLKNITFGLKVNLPYTLENNFDYNEYKETTSLRDSTVAPVTVNGNQIKGTNKFSIPFSFAVGVSLRPVNFAKINVDYKYNPFSKGTYDYDAYDSTKSMWTSSLPKLKSFQSSVNGTPNLNSFHAGIEITPIEYLSLMAGYSVVTEDLRPEDHFKIEKVGTKVDVYSVGLCINLPYVELNIAYEWKSMKYIDYYSYHADYIKWDTQNLYTGITVRL